MAFAHIEDAVSFDVTYKEVKGVRLDLTVWAPKKAASKSPGIVIYHPVCVIRSLFKVVY
jgi:cephalosporin-C deacetylase-like acetyl esterase